MLRGMYAAASGLDGNLISQDTVSMNLAHNNVPGYRRQGAVFETFETLLGQATAANLGASLVAGGPQGQLPPPPPVAEGGHEIWGTRPSFIYTDFTQGPLKNTGNAYDLAAGDATTYFVVVGPNGPLLTRDGGFTLDNLGQLISRSTGALVSGQGGRIVIPPNAANVTIGQEGLVTADGVQIGNLLLATVLDPSTLVRVGDTLFQGPVPTGTPRPGTVYIQQGYLEESNGNIVQDMVGLINNLRHYEASERSLKALSEAVSLITRPAAV